MRVPSQSRRNSTTTQRIKSKSLARLLNNVTQARHVTRLINSPRDPIHEQSHLLLFFLAIPALPPPLGSSVIFFSNDTTTYR
jgi:hypothetical protein